MFWNRQLEVNYIIFNNCTLCILDVSFKLNIYHHLSFVELFLLFNFICYNVPCMIWNNILLHFIPLLQIKYNKEAWKKIIDSRGCWWWQAILAFFIVYFKKKFIQSITRSNWNNERNKARPRWNWYPPAKQKIQLVNKFRIRSHIN